MNLIKHVPQIVKLKIINNNTKSGEEAYGRITAHHQDIWEPIESAVFNGGFSQFIGEELYRWLSRNVKKG